MISTHAPAGGATRSGPARRSRTTHFYSRPCGRGDTVTRCRLILYIHFYSRPCGRGDDFMSTQTEITRLQFLLTPLREGRPWLPCDGRTVSQFLLTPLREGRHSERRPHSRWRFISTHAPAGGATPACVTPSASIKFLLTPLREGRPHPQSGTFPAKYFYSRPCGRGD